MTKRLDTCLDDQLDGRVDASSDDVVFCGPGTLQGSVVRVQPSEGRENPRGSR